MEFDDPYEHENPALIYTPENIPTAETEDQFNEQFIGGCECKALCTVENKCLCVQKSATYYVTPQVGTYDDYTINITDSNKPIYECNTKCECFGTSCRNRLVQFGPRKFLKINACDSDSELNLSTSSKKIKLEKNERVNQREENTRGLGLFTKKNIKRGNFICEYAGEIITKDEAIARHKINEHGAFMNYIFCIKEHFGENTIETYIDPSKFGNIGRYLNHSCNPNCELIPIRVNNTIPKLCIFALTDVSENSELTFDYGSNSLEDNFDKNRIKCLCGTVKCRKYLPFSTYST